MKHFLRKEQIFTFNWKTCDKYLVAPNPHNLEVLLVDDFEKVITQYRTESKADGWRRDIEEKIDCTVKNKDTLNAQFKVESVSYSGGGTGHGQHDIYPDGHYVTARKVGSCVNVSFYQSGCFQGMIHPEYISFVSGPEDKEVTLKRIWVEE